MKRYFFMLYFVSVFLFFTSNIIAFSARPNILKIYFEPNFDKNYTIYVDAKNVIANVNGPLSDYILIYKQTNKSYLVNVRLPKEMPHGSYNNEILFYEMPRNEEDRTADAMLSKESVNITIIFPAKKQLEYSINITKNKNNEIIFDITLFNAGVERVQNAKAAINIYRSDAKIDGLQTNEISLEPKQKDDLIAIWKMPESGNYTIAGLLEHDTIITGFKREIDTDFLEYNESFGLKYSKTIIIIIFLLFALNITWIFYFKKIFNKQKQ